MRATMARSRPTMGTSWSDHLPRPSFSFSPYAGLPCELKRGRLLESRRMCLVKKPWFWVANEGYPPFPLRFVFVDSHTTGAPLDPEYALDGLDRPLVFRPGLAHPPPGAGEGLRDKDMAESGVPGNGHALVSTRARRGSERGMDTHLGSSIKQTDGAAPLGIEKLRPQDQQQRTVDGGETGRAYPDTRRSRRRISLDSPGSRWLSSPDGTGPRWSSSRGKGEAGERLAVGTTNNCKGAMATCVAFLSWRCPFRRVTRTKD